MGGPRGSKTASSCIHVHFFLRCSGGGESEALFRTQGGTGTKSSSTEVSMSGLDANRTHTLGEGKAQIPNSHKQDWAFRFHNPPCYMPACPQLRTLLDVRIVAALAASQVPYCYLTSVYKKKRDENRKPLANLALTCAASLISSLSFLQHSESPDLISGRSLAASLSKKFQGRILNETG